MSENHEPSPVNCDEPSVIDFIMHESTQEETMKGSTGATFSCPICLDDECSDGLKNSNCGHIICRNCMAEHCQFGLTTKKVPFLCPYGCKIHLPLAMVKELLTSRGDVENGSSHHGGEHPDLRDDWDKYRRLLLLSRNETIRECPGCNNIVNKDQSTNDMTCQRCERTFCFVHGMMHRDMTCDEYQQTPQGRELEETELTLLRYTKPCSHCGTALQKSYGCGYVVCASCHEGMCYNCGTHVYLRGSDERPICLGCKSEYVDHRYDTLRRIRLLLGLPFLVPPLITFCFTVVICNFLVAAMGWIQDPFLARTENWHIVPKIIISLVWLILVLAFAIPLTIIYFAQVFILCTLSFVFRQLFIFEFVVTQAFGNKVPIWLRTRREEELPINERPANDGQPPEPAQPAVHPSKLRVNVFQTLRPFFSILDEFGIPATRAMLNMPTTVPTESEIPSLPVGEAGDGDV